MNTVCPKCGYLAGALAQNEAPARTSREPLIEIAASTGTDWAGPALGVVSTKELIMAANSCDRPEAEFTAVRQLMSPNPVTIHVDHCVADAARQMAEADVGFLIVVDGDEIVGTVTDRDIVIRSVAQRHGGTEQTVGGVMTRHVVHCFEETSVADALTLMAEQRVRRLVVVDAVKDLAGIFSVSDAVRAGQLVAQDRLAALWQSLATATETAKTPGPEDPTGGRARRSERGILHVYSTKPRIRRQSPRFGE